MKPICVPCRRFYRPERNGYAFVEGMPKGPKRAPAGNEAPDQWKPYKLWIGDLWRCHGCSATIIVGVAGSPLAEHFQKDFATKVERHGAVMQVNDC